MRIAIDAMGGDHAPKAIIEGALEAAPHAKCGLILVGNSDQMKPYLPPQLPANVTLVEAKESVGMEEKPLDAYRSKPNSSLRVCADLVLRGEADGMLSAGNTGACVATCQLTWRQIPGMHRPAIGSIMPNQFDRKFLLLDSGASPDIDPEIMVEFALMGRAYMEKAMGRRNPKVHLINIGEEEGKGNAFTKQAYNLLKEFHWFAGNIEGKDLFNKPCDIALCDAFVGNVILKTSEGLAELMFNMIKHQVPGSKLAQVPYLPLKKVMRPIKKHADWAEVGGSPLLGLNGDCTIAHGRSDARAIKNAILLADRSVQGRVLATIKESITQEMKEVLS
ncbi:MAG: phosphate acyltransferase PlsX [Armatimonadetes bacterium]|nr:phosphate acyltransferase PlsX [Armatimonadota bacterium]